MFWRLDCRFQVQRPVPEPDPEVGDGLVEHQRDPGEVAARAEHVGLPRGCLRRRGHRQAAAQGGQEVLQDRQVLAEDHDQGP